MELFSIMLAFTGGVNFTAFFTAWADKREFDMWVHGLACLACFIPALASLCL